MTAHTKNTPTKWTDVPQTAILVLANGQVIRGYGIGATGENVGEVCFNTAITGYQEILTDPSYAGQIITFTFPHIGNVGANPEDIESSNPERASDIRGCIIKADITNPANYRMTSHLNEWLKAKNIIGIAGVDTRALTAYIRKNGMPNAVIAHNPDAQFDIPDLATKAEQWPGLEGMDLAKSVTSSKSHTWDEGLWQWNKGYPKQVDNKFNVVAIDFGMKKNILRCLTDAGCNVTVVPAETSAEEILALNPDGIFLSNGPGDPAATGEYAVPQVKKLLAANLPIFGICLGHQILALALGAKTKKMPQGHHGANHPVKDFTTNKVEITSMNHGFTVDTDNLPAGIEETHTSLFDGTNCGLKMTDKPVFSVQYHPEASPGPQDSHYLFTRFVDLIKETKEKTAA
ncbi:MAG: glutamine-hydrolyzing carbamoyl-phosphate synthase small subunit [Methyloligellaceae bacterium]